MKQRAPTLRTISKNLGIPDLKFSRQATRVALRGVGLLFAAFDLFVAWNSALNFPPFLLYVKSLWFLFAFDSYGDTVVFIGVGDGHTERVPEGFDLKYTTRILYSAIC